MGEKKNTDGARVMCHSHLVNTSLFVIFTNQHLQNLDRSQNQMAIEVTLNTFFYHHKEKQKKAIWPRQTSFQLGINGQSKFNQSKILKVLQSLQVHGERQ